MLNISLKRLLYPVGLTAILRRISECHYYRDKKLACRIRLLTVTDGWTVREINGLSDEWEVSPSSNTPWPGRLDHLLRGQLEMKNPDETEAIN